MTAAVTSSRTTGSPAYGKSKPDRQVAQPGGSNDEALFHDHDGRKQPCRIDARHPGECAGAGRPRPVEQSTQDEGGLTDIIVTATKRGSAQNVQDVPIAITAFGSSELDSIHARSIASVSYAVPNASLESVGTTPGYANFSIRGLGINSSIPSIDPTVGVFVDGVYLGVSAGVLFDTFDLEGVEILRGPQGCCSAAT